MAKLLAHSKSNGAFSRRRESICKVETRRSIGYLRVGVLFSILLRRTQKRLSAASIGVRSDACWGSSPKPNLFRGVVRGFSVSVWSITPSIHRVGFSFRCKQASELPIGTKVFG